MLTFRKGWDLHQLESTPGHGDASLRQRVFISDQYIRRNFRVCLCKYGTTYPGRIPAPTRTGMADLVYPNAAQRDVLLPGCISTPWREVRQGRLIRLLRCKRYPLSVRATPQRHADRWANRQQTAAQCTHSNTPSQARPNRN